MGADQHIYTMSLNFLMQEEVSKHFPNSNTRFSCLIYFIHIKQEPLLSSHDFKDDPETPWVEPCITI